jgi:7-cyano-7-deazaguanine synthase
MIEHDSPGFNKQHVEGQTQEVPWDSSCANPLQDIQNMLRRRAYPMKGIAVVSGGLDSTTMIYHMLNDGHQLDLVSFDYGQRHRKELQFAVAIAKQLHLTHDIVDLRGLTHLISNSALTSTRHRPKAQESDKRWDREIEVPDGHYAEENMKATVVPNRNMIMLAIAAGIAVNREAEFVATAVHAGDHFIYPDCRPAFISATSQAVWIGNEGFGSFKYNDEAVLAPFLHWTKEEIAYRALQLGVPLHMTWSCYKGNEKHCGRCGTCVERLEAIDAAIRLAISNNSDTYAEDMTEYEDTEFWKVAVRGAKQ